MRKLITIAALLFLSAGAHAACTLTSSAPMVLRGGSAALAPTQDLACQQAFVLDLGSINSLSAVASYSSATLMTQTFGTGAAATGSVTVNTNSALSQATAVNNITIPETSVISGAAVILPGYVLREGVNWTGVGKTPSQAASSLASALSAAQIPGLAWSATGSVVYGTATAPGSIYNRYYITSTSTDVVVATPQFTGGQDAASVLIGGVQLLEGRDWSVGAAATNTAANIAAAVGANAVLSKWVSASASGAAVDLTTTFVGASADLALMSSTPTALAMSGAEMSGGANASYNLNSGTINLPGHGYPTGAAVNYQAGSSPAIGGLVSGTTYYVIALDANDLQLATSQTNAAAGTFVSLTSSSTLTAADSYTLSPLAISGTPGIAWEVSNDDASWVALAPTVSSVTISSYSNPPAFTGWNLGNLGYRYVEAVVAPPTTGALSVGIIVNAQ